MSASTTRLNLTKPGGGSTGLIVPPDPVDIDVLNANFDKIDDAMGLKVVTSVTRPSTPFDGQPIFETDTELIRVFRQSGSQWVAPGYGRGPLTDYLVVNPTGLDGITDARTGDSAWMTSPGTGIDPMRWRAYSGSGGGIDWQPEGTVVADTKANLDAFVTAVAAISDTRFQVGGRAYIVAGGIEIAFTSVTGDYRALPGVIIPTEVTNGSLANGGRASSAAGQSLVRLRTCFPDPFRIFQVEFDVVTSAASAPLARLASGATDANTNYALTQVRGFATTVDAVTTTGNAMSLGVLGAAARHHGTLLLINPNQAAQTEWTTDTTTHTNPMTSGGSNGKGQVGGNHTTVSAYDSLCFTVNSGTIQLIAAVVRGIA